MSKSLIKPGSASLRFWQLLLLVVILGVWHLASRDPKVAFFFGEPLKVWGRIWAWFVTNADIYTHLWVTLTETVLAFFIGTAAGLGAGLWLGLSPLASAILDPYIKAANSMPRVILAPIFGMWFGLGIWSKVALAVTLVFFIVFFNVYQGVREVSPRCWTTRACWARAAASCCAACTCRPPPAGCSPACTPPSAWPSWARWWASTWVRPAAWAT